MVVFAIALGSAATGALLIWMAATALPWSQPWIWSADRAQPWRADRGQGTGSPEWRLTARAARLHAGGRPRPPVPRRLDSGRCRGAWPRA